MAALLKLMNSPAPDKNASYQNGELIEKSNDQILSEETECRLSAVMVGPSLRLSTYLCGLSYNLPSLPDVGNKPRNQCSADLSLKPPCELF